MLPYLLGILRSVLQRALADLVKYRSDFFHFALSWVRMVQSEPSVINHEVCCSATVYCKG